MKRLVLAPAILAILCNAASAQSHQPYAGFEQRPIKALSEQEVDDLRAGRGMGLALAAELNGYPGPSHVLELADRLDLSRSTENECSTVIAGTLWNGVD